MEGGETDKAKAAPPAKESEMVLMSYIKRNQLNGLIQTPDVVLKIE